MHLSPVVKTHRSSSGYESAGFRIGFLDKVNAAL